MRTKITIEELFESIKDYFKLNDTELLKENKENMKEEINNLLQDTVVACNKEYSVIFDTKALYVEFFDDLITIPFENGKYMIHCLKEAHLEYVPVDLELPIIKNIFSYKIERKKVKSR
jgi:hypothetical protein